MGRAGGDRRSGGERPAPILIESRAAEDPGMQDPDVNHDLLEPSPASVFLLPSGITPSKLQQSEA